MTDPINIPVRRRKKRVAITSRDRQQLERAKKRLDEATAKILYNNPDAAKSIYPQNTLKPCDELVKEWIAANPDWAPRTVAERQHSLSVLSAFIGPRPLSRELIEQFSIDLHKSDFAEGTRHRIGSRVSSFLKWLFETKRIAEDFRAGIRFPKQPAQVPREPYTAAEVKQILEAAGDRPIGFIVLLGWHTGMAITDCCDLTWESVNMETLTITRDRQKTGVESVITVEFGSDLHKALQRQWEDTIRAFGSIQLGLPVCRHATGNESSMRTMFKRLVRDCGIKYKSFHSFRATMLTDLANSDVPINVALKISGLKKVDQLMGYVTTKPEDIRGHLGRIRK